MKRFIRTVEYDEMVRANVERYPHLLLIVIVIFELGREKLNHLEPASLLEHSEALFTLLAALDRSLRLVLT